MDFIRKILDDLESRDLLRTLRANGSVDRTIKVDGAALINFSSNNYLGLANHAELQSAAKAGLSSGTSSGASRLVTGNLAAHTKLENTLAELHGTKSARLFNSGYHANIGLLSAIAGAEDLIVSDQLNHASIIDGCRLSRARIRVSEHANCESIERLLTENRDVRRKFVVVESVYSMDGHIAPLEEIRRVCDAQEAFLIVDEAHAVGTLGPRGAGVCARMNVRPDAMVGGLGKAFGSYGGYVAGSEALCGLLLNRARSFVFSTGLPPAVVAASQRAIELGMGEIGANQRLILEERIGQLTSGLAQKSLLAENAGQTPIFPIIVGSPVKALEWSERLRSQGIFCQAIRPPTVPVGSARLRITLSALHSAEDVDALLDCFG